MPYLRQIIRRWWPIWVLGFAVVAMSAEARPEPAERFATSSKGNDSSFALVELFTSQGCSSCPPADALLRDIDREARRQGKRIFPLSFHVDYWNRLGWRDPYSDPSYSRRQRSYAARVSGGRVYTPQIVVNGSYDVLGSDSASLRSRVRQVLADSSTVRVTLRTTRHGTSTKACASLHAPDGDARVQDASVQDARVHVALVERDLKTRVTRGENAGRWLHHDNVVREMQSIRSGDCILLQHPKNFRSSKASVVAFAQSKSTHRILGATRRDL